MERPKRQHKHLEEKLATKAARRGATGAEKPRPAGKKEKRWKKSADLYRPLVTGGDSAG